MDETSKQRGDRSVYDTRDVWQAAYLALMDVRIVRVYRDDDGRNIWLFDNADDVAWTLGREFRTKGAAMVPILDYRDAYRYVRGLTDEGMRDSRGEPGYVVATSE